MGILNVTPDSFSDGGKFVGLDDAAFQTEKMLREGADIIDIGGESTRPGATLVGEQQELDRVMPVLEMIRERFDTIISVDTSKAGVISAADRSGAGLINDIRALREPGALAAACATGLPVCLMHMQGEPQTMQQNPRYIDVVADVTEFLRRRLAACVDAGMGLQRIVVDPGFGFGKTQQHNVSLLRGLKAVSSIAPLLIGLSRKGMVGSMVGDKNADRITGSVVAALMCVQRGAQIVRVHDVAPTVQALAIQQLIDNPQDVGFELGTGN